MKSNFRTLRHGDPSEFLTKPPRLAFEEACTLL
jgi:hypothetical protein